MNRIVINFGRLVGDVAEKAVRYVYLWTAPSVSIELMLLRMEVRDLRTEKRALQGKCAILERRAAVAEKTLPLYRLALQAIYAGVSDPQDVALQALSRGAEAEGMSVVNEIRN